VQQRAHGPVREQYALLQRFQKRAFHLMKYSEQSCRAD
jgi:hypothetical protein